MTAMPTASDDGEVSARYAPGPATLPERRALRDDDHERAWRRDGFTTVAGAVAEHEIQSLLTLVDDLYVGDRDGFHSTLQSTDELYRKRVAAELMPRFEQLAGELFVDYEPFAASLTIKWPGETGRFGCHQDWTMVDEFRFRTLNIWVPLVPTTLDNGALRVLPGSHLLLDHLRCSPMNPEHFLSEGTDIPVEELVPLPLELGDVAVFDVGVLHGSGANVSDRWRPAITIACKPVEAPLLHHYLPSPSSDTVELYEVDPEFFTEIRIGERPARPVARTVPFYGTSRRSAELLGVGSGSEHGPDRSDAHAEDVWDTPIFRDTDVDREFRERGLVVLDLLDESHLDALRALPGEIFTGEPHGMHASNMCNDHEYRHKVYERVRPILEDVVCDQLIDYEACMAIMLLKFPDDDSQFIPHQDWSLTDESRFRTMNVWCPTVDTDATNGTMSFIPGSHRVLRAVRCDPWFPETYGAPGWDVSIDDMETVEVRAGQALFFDHAIVHASAPNRSGELRPAVALVVKPKAAPMLHWYRPEPTSSELELFEIDSDFLADFEIGNRPEYPLVGPTRFVPDPVDTARLMEQCADVRRDGPTSTAAATVPPPTSAAPTSAAVLVAEAPAAPVEPAAPLRDAGPGDTSAHDGAVLRRLRRAVGSLRARSSAVFGSGNGRQR